MPQPASNYLAAEAYKPFMELVGGDADLETVRNTLAAAAEAAQTAAVDTLRAINTAKSTVATIVALVSKGATPANTKAAANRSAAAFTKTTLVFEAAASNDLYAKITASSEAWAAALMTKSVEDASRKTLETLSELHAMPGSSTPPN